MKRGKLMSQVYYPDKEEFIRRSRSGNLVSVYREILADMETPVSAFKKINTGDYSFLLESVEGGERMARFSFLGSEVSLVIKSKGRTVEVIEDGRTRTITLEPGQDPLHVLKTQLNRFKWVPDPELPRFCGGAVGYIGYDTVRFFEDLPDTSADDLDLDDCLFVFTDTLLVFDHVKHKIKVLCNAQVNGDPSAAYDKAVAKIEALASRLKSPVAERPQEKESPSQAAGTGISSNFTREGFEKAIEDCKEYIAAGDVIQVVLSQRFSCPVSADPFDVYRALRSLNPSPYMYFLSYGDIKLIGSSPEILVTEERGKVTVRPIAGTRPRGQTEVRDRLLEHELLADPKEQAEHAMLVDLARNDLGRVCAAGSVRPTELMQVERFSKVMHIVSTIEGELREDATPLDALAVTFPAGTVTGAPKRRAMELIAEHEPTPRGPYAGAVGYLTFAGDLDFCITIRTAVVVDGVATIQTGAGVVADSEPETELRETKAKAAALIPAVAPGVDETMGADR
jgi:anthranilate synthase component 1